MFINWTENCLLNERWYWRFLARRVIGVLCRSPTCINRPPVTWACQGRGQMVSGEATKGQREGEAARILPGTNTPSYLERHLVFMCSTGASATQNTVTPLVTAGVRVRSKREAACWTSGSQVCGRAGQGRGARSCGFPRPLGEAAFAVLVRAAGQCRQPRVLQRPSRQAGRLDRSPGLQHSSAAGFFLGALMGSQLGPVQGGRRESIRGPLAEGKSAGISRTISGTSVFWRPCPYWPL